MYNLVLGLADMIREVRNSPDSLTQNLTLKTSLRSNGQCASG